MIEIIFLKFALIFVMSFLFGIERQLSNKPIGFGTFIFVAVGSCALGAISLTLSPNNVLIIIGGVVTGIGFLGAGALIKTTDKIFGFTTAASIWIFAIIGLCVGLEEYFLGGITYSIVWMVILIDRFLEFNGIGTYQRKVTINTNGIIEKNEILRLFERNKWKLIDFEVDKKKKKSTISYLVSCHRSYINHLKESLVSKNWIESFKIE
jgi:putative Mg2+ transporter-C (MgtC) family protein